MFEIIKNALASLSKSWTIFYLFPCIIAIGSGVYTLFVDPSVDVFGDVVGPIGIFSALMFSVIFIVVEHFLKRKDAYNSEDDEDKRYLENYQGFTRETVARIAFSIFLAGWIILLAFLLPQIRIEGVWWPSLRNVFFAFFLLQYIALIIIVVKDMYAMLIDDTEHNR